jgi:transposase
VEREERRRRAVELHQQQGLSTQKVADALGCTWETARRDLEAAGFTFRHSKRAIVVEERECARDGCSNMFRPTPGQLLDGHGKYCSRKCDHEAHRIHPVPEERVCARDGCENRFTPGASNVALGWGHYCSRRCSALSTGAHQRKKGREVDCFHCGKTEWRYDSQIVRNEHGVFCSRECWGEYRWTHGIAISPKVVSLARGGARQKWHGRWSGHKGAAGGIEGREGGREGGRPPKATKEQAAECWRLHAEGRSTRQIAAEVFGDARYSERVRRIVRIG